MMSLPPPAVKPTMMWIGFVGYFAGSSWATAEQVRAINPRHRAGEKRRRETFIDLLPSQRRNQNMQHRGLAVITGGAAAVDRGGEVIRLGDAFAVRAERPRRGGELPPRALPARLEP